MPNYLREDTKNITCSLQEIWYPANYEHPIINTQNLHIYILYLHLPKIRIIMEKLKKRWGITSNWQVIAIFIVFAINGSFAAWVAGPITNFFGLSAETTKPYFLYIVLRIVLIFPIYQITLPLVGWVFGQFTFFWNFEKKMLQRMGLGRFFK